ncbi:MAG: sulfite exporter TauE/SafE family protein [Burkholderiales bacterium]|nr:sulfite exporter TauE/SafE family protein [Burkholderiales bacterium]MDQ3195977.1 sulfite exporter TauE/SafE family protein [Pseudomonadota bacterium]
MTSYVLIFLAGIAGSMHCVGMCGGFVCAMKPDPRGTAATARRHLIYNSGRVTTYVFLGAVVGFAGASLVAHDGGDTTASAAQRLLALVSGALMVFIGLQFLGAFKTRVLSGAGGRWLANALRDLLNSPSNLAPLAFGVLNGFLPCPLVYAFAAQAAASGGPDSGAAIMLAFGLGTFPAMLAMGGAGVWLRSARSRAPQLAFPTHDPKTGARAGAHIASLPRADWRQNGVRLAGVFIVLLGIITLARGLLPFSAHLH